MSQRLSLRQSWFIGVTPWEQFSNELHKQNKTQNPSCNCCWEKMANKYYADDHPFSKSVNSFSIAVALNNFSWIFIHGENFKREKKGSENWNEVTQTKITTMNTRCYDYVWIHCIWKKNSLFYLYLIQGKIHVSI